MLGYAAAWIALVGCLLGQCLAVPHSHDVQPAEHAAVPHVHLSTAHGHRHGPDGHHHDADGLGPQQAEAPAETVDLPHDSDCLFPVDADVAARGSDAKSFVAAEMPAAPLAATCADLASVGIVVAPPCDTFPPPCPRFLQMRNLRL